MSIIERNIRAYELDRYRGRVNPRPITLPASAWPAEPPEANLGRTS